MFALLEYLFDLIVVIIIGGLLTRAMKSLFRTPPASPGGSPSGSGHSGGTMQSGETARDPVCGMFVSTELSHKLSRGANAPFLFAGLPGALPEECRQRLRMNGRRPATFPEIFVDIEAGDFIIHSVSRRRSTTRGN